jgi:hypothetical protein
VKGILQVTQEAFDAKYLGLPTPEGRMGKERFKSLQMSLAKKLVEYDDGHLTQAAKEILIKAVAQALPVYIMGVFKIPFGLCDELTQMIIDYWWGKEDGKHKMHWISWDDLLRPKCRGGIGFKDLRLFNQALLAREGCSFVVCCIDFRPVFR